jgi:protein TonB
MIDFVGGPTTISSAGPAAAAAPRPSAAPREIAQQADADAVALKGRRHGPFVLPRPSLLKGNKRDDAQGAETSSSLAGASAEKTPETAGTSPGAGSAQSAGAGISTDLPNFPYPWYISQVRTMLWESWRKRMPRLDAEGAVGFSILRNGAFTDLTVESSSGDAGFDSAALAAVQSAAPFPALPTDFTEPFLKIHLTLKSTGL